MSETSGKIVIEVDEAFFDEEAAKKKTVRVFTFLLGGEYYGFPVGQVCEVVKVGELTKVPNAPEFIVGVINLRGQVTVLCDISYFLGLERKERTRDARAVITDLTGSP